jgi:hypothetical protein
MGNCCGSDKKEKEKSETAGADQMSCYKPGLLLSQLIN